MYGLAKLPADLGGDLFINKLGKQFILAISTGLDFIFILPIFVLYKFV